MLAQFGTGETCLGGNTPKIGITDADSGDMQRVLNGTSTVGVGMTSTTAASDGAGEGRPIAQSAAFGGRTTGEVTGVSTGKKSMMGEAGSL
jgi:hypothetical protein